MNEIKPVGDTNYSGQPVSHPVRVWAWVLVLLGLAIVGYATLGYDPSVESTGMYGIPDHIVNTGRLQTQTLTFDTGAIFFLSGVICFSTDIIYRLLREIAHRQLGYGEQGQIAEEVQPGEAPVVQEPDQA
ncbi:hypothetical protein HZF05_16565 [Sphingomonas sp. CGMCC 1.13654]|uniref:Uncharacterized protein n=1 Tax=Sphingomonas chungangi TaxID=2683589 RepID=A0A838LDY4_9SPHN|nr:hypothetical protein [Sphingomonas chungangi]MBA2935698.1 hypothetical protein [Sphingomonas chungangi]MVW54388.1 hypothetical protein [Sphingomonas chungangi]